jgi:pyruvate dehydrogenase E1 component alpha subunit
MRVADAAQLPDEQPVQLIDEHGAHTMHERYQSPTLEVLVECYADLVKGRRINEQCNALVRQGRLAVYPSSHGQEACQIAAAAVLGADDWLFPTYRDSVAVMARGVSPEDAMVLLRGDWHSGYNSRDHRVAPQATPLATQLLHAAGFAHAAKLRGEETVVLAMCGDGATSEGDFHEAMNFAAVFGLPVVFFVQNNEFAISVPLSRQSAALSLAHKAIGYGMHGQRVDGNDMAAVLSVLGEAVSRARAGSGPTLVEAHTYRMQAHTNADDDTRYRDREEVLKWISRDPLVRLRAHLRDAAVLDDAAEQRFAADAEAIASKLREAMNREITLNPEELFAHVFAERPAALAAQWALLQDEIERTEVTA